MKPAPTSHTILCNVAQQVQSYLDLPPAGLVDTVDDPPSPSAALAGIGAQRRDAPRCAAGRCTRGWSGGCWREAALRSAGSAVGRSRNDAGGVDPTSTVFLTGLE